MSALCVAQVKYSAARFAALKPLDQMVPPRPKADERQERDAGGGEAGCWGHCMGSRQN